MKDRRIDVVYDRTFLATLDSGPATWWRPTSRVSTVVADPKVQMDLYFPRRQWLWWRFARRVYRTANVVVANSEGLRQQVIDYFRLPPGHVRVLPNVIDVERINALASQPPAGKPADEFRILTVGRIDEHKGHRDLLEAVRLLVQEKGLTRIAWQIVGDGPSRGRLVEEVRRLNLEKHVAWLGVVANPYPYYRAADVYCSPSLTEGSPNVLLEALCLGTPVVSTDCPSGPREILEGGKWGTLVPPRNPQALAEAIRDRMANPENWRKRAQEAQPVIRERYDSRMGVRRLEELLLHVLVELRGSSPAVSGK
jgi:glycosyltransferase involved in cell wall biosynthesis